MKTKILASNYQLPITNYQLLITNDLRILKQSCLKLSFLKVQF